MIHAFFALFLVSISYFAKGSNKKKGVRMKQVTLSRKDVRKTVDLGGGFERHDFYPTIQGNTYYSFTFNAGNLKPISASFVGSLNGQGFDPYWMMSYPFGLNAWRVVVHNPSNLSIFSGFAGFYFITKT